MNNDTTLLLHVDDSEPEIGDCIDGRPYILPAGEPVELPAFHAQAILNHIGPLYGIVEVQTVKTKTGVEYKVDEAKAKAAEYLKQCQKRVIDFYVRQQMEDRISAGKPALPPTGRALAVITKLGISLRKEYGLTPVGWSDPGESLPNAVAQVSADHQKVIEQQSKTISDLQAQLDVTNRNHQELTDKFNKLMDLLGAEHADEKAPQTPVPVSVMPQAGDVVIPAAHE